MANRVIRDAQSIHGRNPLQLIETVIRLRIWDSVYWKEECFALTAESIIDKAITLQYIGGTYANTRPTEFLCLTLKLLQLQPDKEIILEYLRAEEFKYLRALAAFYVRLTFSALDVYNILEPLLQDYRKLRYRAMDGSYSILNIDQFIDELLNDERVCDIQLPRLTQRRVLQQTEALPNRQSKLGKALGYVDSDEEAMEQDGERFISRSPSVDSQDRYISRSPSVEVDRSDAESDRYISRSPTPEP